jgi:hypothetical protein
LNSKANCWRSTNAGRHTEFSLAFEAVVRELIRSLEQTVATLRGRDASLAFREKMAPLL